MIEAPLDRYRDVVRPEWIDHNQHMNMGYYLVVFDYATDEFFRWVGSASTMSIRCIMRQRAFWRRPTS